MVHSKVQVDAGAPAQAVYRKFETPPTESFRLFEEERVLTEFKESVVQTWEGPGRLSSGAPGTTNLDVVKSWPGRPFEMPDGWNQVFGAERFRPAETLFDENSAITVSIIAGVTLQRCSLTSTRIQSTQSQSQNKPFQG
jgi:actin-related protein 4